MSGVSAPVLSLRQLALAYVERIVFDSPDYYRQQLQQLSGNKYAQVTIKSLRARRSSDQNAYWHGVRYPVLAALTGYTEAEVKEVTKRMFLSPRIVTIKGVEYEIRPGTSDLTKAEGVEYTNAMFGLAHELGGHIPTPEESGYGPEKKAGEDIRDSEDYPEMDGMPTI